MEALSIVHCPFRQAWSCSWLLPLHIAHERERPGIPARQKTLNGLPYAFLVQYLDGIIVQYLLVASLSLHTEGHIASKSSRALDAPGIFHQYGASPHDPGSHSSASPRDTDIPSFVVTESYRSPAVIRAPSSCEQALFRTDERCIKLKRGQSSDRRYGTPTTLDAPTAVCKTRRLRKPRTDKTQTSVLTRSKSILHILSILY